MSLHLSILLVHAAATLFMLGVIWFVQIVHYPLFGRVEVDFAGYAAEHQRRTSWVVVGPMLVEAGTAVALVVLAPQALAWLVWLNLALLVGVWLSTFLLQVPRHRQLLAGKDEGTIRSLVSTNALRTALWTARSAVVLALVLRLL